MLEELVFIRHGKAAKRGPGIIDGERALTDQGVLEMHQLVPPLVRLISNRRVLIWSSPLRRALQTAAILAGPLGVDQITTCECISVGDWRGFSRELVQIRSPQVLVVVGHQPHLSEWSQSLAGLPLPYKKGAAAGFNMRSCQPVLGDLLWFIQPKALMRLGPSSALPQPPA